MSKLSKCVALLFSFILMQCTNVYALLNRPYYQHNILQKIFNGDSDNCFIVEDVKVNESNIFMQNIKVVNNALCTKKKDALINLLSQSNNIFLYPNYQLTVDNSILPSSIGLNPDEEVEQIKNLFSNNSYFISANQAPWVKHPNMPHMSPAVMLLFKPEVIGVYSDNLSQNKQRNYLTSAELITQIFDWQKSTDKNNNRLWISNSIDQ